MSLPLVIDSSAIIAILNGEPEAASLAAACADASVTIGWPTVLEVRLWTSRRPPQVAAWLSALLDDPSTEPVAFDRDHERLATIAFERFGRGRHPAGLNFGDCMAYAVAKQKGLPLLFKGSDFGRTDIAVHPAAIQL